jgi:hypothetical protein
MHWLSAEALLVSPPLIFCARPGMSVALGERGRIGHIDTGHTTAHLTAVTDMRLHQLVDNFGPDHPLKYLGAIVQLLAAENCFVFEESEAQEFDEKKRRAKVNGQWINYGLVLLATHNPLAGESGAIGSLTFQTKLALDTSYAIGARVPRGSHHKKIPSALPLIRPGGRT